MYSKEIYKEALDLICSGASTSDITNRLSVHGVSARTIRKWAKDYRDITKANPIITVPSSIPEPVAAGSYVNAHACIGTLPDGRYVLTSAQAGTYINENFVSSLLMFCAKKNAELLVAPIEYNAKRTKGWFDHRITGYLCTSPVRLAPDLVFAAGLNVLPTVARPLAGFGSYFREGSGIVPHTKMHMESLPRYKGCDPRFLYTTGTITRRNYTRSKSGAIADFHHVFGALLVEVKDGKWFARQLVSDENGEFCDLGTHFTPAGTQSQRVAAITWGDLHREKLSQDMIKTMIDIMSDLNPEVVVCHDVLDFAARSYHTRDNWDARRAFYEAGADNVEAMLVETGGILRLISRYADETVVVPSNHDRHLEQWLSSTPEQFDHDNIATYHRLNYLKYTTAYGTVLELALKEIGDAWNITFLKEDERYERNGIEYSLHGDSGPNGSRGSPNNLRGIGVKLNTGHTHSAGIIDGVYTGGCMCSLDMGYNTGPSSWSQSFILTYQNGKRSIVTIRDETQWRI